MAEPSDSDIRLARQRGAEALTQPRATAARYIAERERFEIDLASGWSIQVPRSFSQRTAAATPDQCSRIEVTDGGLGLNWPLLDEDWFIPAVIEVLLEGSAA